VATTPACGLTISPTLATVLAHHFGKTYVEP
jgi:hypothetical protein